MIKRKSLYDPSSQANLKREVRRKKEAKKILTDQLLWLASGRMACKPEEAEANLHAFKTLLHLGTNEIGAVCSGVCHERIRALESATDSQASSQLDYCKQGNNLQTLFARNGYTYVPTGTGLLRTKK